MCDSRLIFCNNKKDICSEIMLLPLSKQLGRKPASALENQKLGVHRNKMFLAILGLFQIFKPTYAEIYHCFCQKKKPERTRAQILSIEAKM